MFESSVPEQGKVPPSNDELAAFRTSLLGSDPALDDVTRCTRIRRLEELKAAVAAAQAVEVATLVESRRAAARAEIAATRRPGVGTRRRIAEAERGIVTDVAQALRESPTKAQRCVGFATSARRDLPAAFAKFAAGTVNEKRMLTLHRATSWLSAEQRRTLDAELAPRLAEWGDKQVDREARAAAYRLDPQGACDRAAAAQNERHVTLRPAPETMTWLSLLLPMAQGVAAWAALDRAAKAAKATGDPRGRGQLMADTAVERLTGQATADAVPVAVQLIITDQTLTNNGAGAGEPARLVGHGPLPAPFGRDLVLDNPAAVTVRRLFTDPPGRLIAMESATRQFTTAMRDFVKIRDDLCRTPWCDAPTQHIDHIEPAAEHGPTSVVNARGYCAHCNYAAQAEGAISRAVRSADGSHTVIGLTPLGQPQRSRPPDLPGSRYALSVGPIVDLIWEPLHHHAA